MTAYVRSLRDAIHHRAKETLRYYRQHERDRVPSEAEALRRAKSSVLLDAAFYQHARITAGLPVHTGVVKMILAFIEKGGLYGYPTCDAADLRQAIGA